MTTVEIAGSNPGNLPPELWDSIVSKISDCQKDLRACASTSPFFRKASLFYTNILRSDPVSEFEKNTYTTFAEKFRGYASLPLQILRIKQIAIVAGVIAGFAGIVTSGGIAKATGAFTAVAGVVSGIIAYESSRSLPLLVKLTTVVTIGGALGIATDLFFLEQTIATSTPVIIPVALLSGICTATTTDYAGEGNEITHIWEEKRRYLESCAENHAFRLLIRAVIRNDLTFLPNTELYRAARAAYQGERRKKTRRFSSALAEQIIRSSTPPTAGLQRFLPPDPESKINQLRTDYARLRVCEKRAFSLHTERLAAEETPSIDLQHLVRESQEFAVEIADNLSPNFLAKIDECAREL